ncbi:pre-rRNA-processing ESF1 [Lecanosticta acicola]|uniref:Pre-rRNA-processing ESF1 n=1 Tax=Lecanosticta acicola TaxID=111012 RepID=A0AAI8Z0U7_9PEZI|nr:pre-rRNA-processing ESF1 [Lecanosticta acicola]
MADPRFSALSTDPRYRLPSRKEARTAVDPRFKTLFTDEEFRKKASVDRYGRKIKPEAGKKDLERLYRLDKKESPKLGTKAERQVVGSSDESERDESDASEDEQLVTRRDPAREGGFSESESSEEETSDEEESDSEAELAEDTAGQEQTEDIPMGEVSRRIACVNLDWDNIRAADLMAVAQSFAPNSGRVESVTIYPSEFGRERLEREEIEGPPKEIFASSSNRKGEESEDEDDNKDEDEESSDDDEKIKKRILRDQAKEGEEFDTAKLRQYQLDRLRYYYAVISCDNKQTAKALYDAMDGREYLSTSNFFDLRFVPDDTSFDDDKPHDECNQIPAGYKPNDFRTEALTHSKVRLTWDDDDATRKEVQKRAFSRAEMDENDLQAYIGSDDSDADSTTSRRSAAISKAEAKRQKMRAALGLSAEPSKASKKGKDEPVGDMQITFTSGLSGNSKDFKGGVFENEPQDEESTRDRYIRKERERKQKRKEKHKSATDIVEDSTTAGVAEGQDDENDPFDDPFFNDPQAAAAQEAAAKRAAKQAKIAAREAADAEAESRRAELELLMADDADEGANMKHFDMRELEKAQKAARRKGKKGSKKNKETVAAVEDDFKVRTDDPRFKDVFESHEFAVDPTHSAFKGTEGMKTLQEERRKRKLGVEEDGTATGRGGKKKQKKAGGDGEDLKALAARLKKKSKS